MKLPPPSAVVNQKPLASLTAGVLRVYGKIQGDEQNFSTVTATTEVNTNATLTGLLKLCVVQLNNSGTISGSVIQNCAFELPGTAQRATVKYELSSGLKRYELSNHLGNVLTTFSDRRISVSVSNTALVNHYTAVILHSQDYYAFGSTMPSRGYKGTNDYRYGFNGKEDDPETGWQDYGMRMYNPSLGRLYSVDPVSKEYPWYSPYQFAGNTPIQAIDLDGMEPIYYTYWFGLETKPSLKSASEWYVVIYPSINGLDRHVVDWESFKSAAKFNTSKKNTGAYSTIADRHLWYQWASANTNQADNYWFEAASLVTSQTMVGGAEQPGNFVFMSPDASKMLAGVNEFLLKENFKNFGNYALTGGKSPVTWNGESFGNLKGAELDNQMVVIEMTNLENHLLTFKENYIKQNGLEKWGILHKDINELFSSKYLKYLTPDANQYAQKMFKEKFGENTSFDFMEINHRIFQVQMMAKFLREKVKTVKSKKKNK